MKLSPYNYYYIVGYLNIAKDFPKKGKQVTKQTTDLKSQKITNKMC